AVRRRAEAQHGVVAARELRYLARADVAAVEVGVARAVGDEGDRAAVAGPARRRPSTPRPHVREGPAAEIDVPAPRQAARIATGARDDPEARAGGAAGRVRVVVPEVGDLRAVGREHGLARRP